MKNFNSRAFAVLCVVATTLSQAQNTPLITGKVVDGKSNEPIPFATIRLKNKFIGVISNADGDFQLPSRFRLLGDTLLISCIGYTTKMVPLTSLKEGEINTVALSESIGILSEVKITGKRNRRVTPYKIVKSALKSIKMNYPNQPFSYDAYYRDYQIVDSQYVNLNEAIVQVADGGFRTNDHVDTKIYLYEYRRNGDFQRDSLSEAAYDNTLNKFIPNAQLTSFGGNELSILRVHDAIRNNKRFSFSFVSRLSVDFLNNHVYSMSDQVFRDSVPLYCIKFESKPEISGTKHLSRGKIFIEHENFAIHKIEYATYEKEAAGEKLLFDVQLEYARKDSTMHLNYISFNNLFRIRNPSDFKVDDIFVDKSLNAFVVKLSRAPHLASAYNVNNYNFTMAGNRLEIREIRPSDASGNEIIIFLKENPHFNFSNSDTQTLSKLHVEVKGIQDLEGREVNVATFLSVNQFRELFVQKMNTAGDGLIGNSLINKDKPIQHHGYPTLNVQNAGYWMNTPLKTN
jgi:hypothetical protein